MIRARVELSITTSAAGVLPNVTVASDGKLAPVTTTKVPPLWVGPELGPTLMNTGGPEGMTTTGPSEHEPTRRTREATRIVSAEKGGGAFWTQSLQQAHRIIGAFPTGARRTNTTLNGMGRVQKRARSCCAVG